MLQVLRTLAHAVCLLALGSVAALAQPPGLLAGVVGDATGGALPGVTMTVTSALLAAPRTAITNERGRYQFDALPAGRYVVNASLGGFEPRIVEVGIDGGATTLDLELAVSSFFESVTVTATKTGATDIQSTPVAITALSAKTLEQMGAQTVESLVGVVPSLTISQHTGLGQVTIRGIGSNLLFTGSDPSTTIHMDGVYLARPAMVFADFLNLERIEVLRGPQGTLYGRNSVGGTINIVSRQPTNAREMSARLTAGGYGALRAEGAISGPLIKDKVMGNFAFIRGTRDGFVKDLNNPDHSLGTEDTWAGRGQMRFVFGTRGELLLSGDYGRFDGVPLTYAKPIAAKPGFSFVTPDSMWEVRTNHLASGRNVQQGVSAKLTIPVNGTTTLNSLTAWRGSNHHYFIDADLTEQTLQTTDYSDVQRQTSQELTLVRRTPALTWIGGAFFFDEHDQQPGVELTLFGPGLQSRPYPRIEALAWALFGQASYRVSSRVSLTGGVRYTDEQKDFENSGGLYRPGTAVLAVPSSFYHYVDRASFNAWTPKAGIDVQAARDTLVYVSATRGFKSGGFNPSTLVPGRAYGPEFAWSYEGGLKTTVAGGRVRVNTAMFYTDYQDLQVQSFIGFGVLDISNAASAAIKGVEIEAAVRPSASLQLASSFSWLDARYRRYLAVGPGGVTRDAAGHRLNNAPGWSGSQSAVYEFATGRAGTAFVRGDLSWQSRVFFTAFNDGIETQEARGLVNLRAGFEPRHRRWEIAVYARNVGNREYITGSANFPPNAIGGRPGDPRHCGTQFTLRY